MAENPISPAGADADEPTAAEYRSFLARFEPDRMPFCPAGLRILYAISRNRPHLYEMARQYGFAYLDDPAFQTSADCRALMTHVSTCELCQAC